MTENEGTTTIKTDVLIVGTGPAGASLASFLGYYGITGILISRDVSTALQPRAHFTNQATWECLRDIGLEAEWRQVSLPRKIYGDHRFTFSLAGKDLLRQHGLTSHPYQAGQYEDASPCEHADVSQNTGEPILMKFATQHGFKSRHNCKFLKYEQDASTRLITSTILDELTNTQFQVVSKYLCGADGASSYIARQAGLPFHTSPTGGLALNVWYEADLSHIYTRNPGVLNTILTPEIDPPDWAIRGVNRVTQPYNEFVMALVAKPSVTSIDASEEQVIQRMREMIGDPKVDIKIKGIYRWRINEAYAEVISKDNQIFCLGDAIHRHPPGSGLGSNTCIQDAYNLAWKLAYVLQGKADSDILSSYNPERQPIAKRIVGVANDTFRIFYALDKALGLMEPTAELRMAAINQLSEISPEGAARRVALRKAYEKSLDESTGIGAELNQAYVSNAIFTDHESDPHPGWEEGSNGLRNHTISTYPGSRLPHAWLGTSEFGEKISTHDLAGKGEFTLFTGIGGQEAWTKAAKVTQAVLGTGVKINVRCIGFGQEYSDLYFMWEDRRGVDEDGAVLVRPDRTVAWRSKSLSDSAAAQLPTVMKKILGFE